MAAKIRGLGVATVLGFGSANGGVVFGEVGQASGHEEVVLAAVTICWSFRRRSPNPRTGGEARLGGSLVSPRTSPGGVCAVGGRRLRGSRDGARRQSQLQPPRFPPLPLFPFDVKTV